MSRSAEMSSGEDSNSFSVRHGSVTAGRAGRIRPRLRRERRCDFHPRRDPWASDRPADAASSSYRPMPDADGWVEDCLAGSQSSSASYGRSIGNGVTGGYDCGNLSI